MPLPASGLRPERRMCSPKFRILPGDFTEANGMLTPSLKVKRTVVAKEYADEIAAIYR